MWPTLSPPRRTAGGTRLATVVRSLCGSGADSGCRKTTGRTKSLPIAFDRQKHLHQFRSRPILDTNKNHSYLGDSPRINAPICHSSPNRSAPTGKKCSILDTAPVAVSGLTRVRQHSKPEQLFHAAGVHPLRRPRSLLMKQTAAFSRLRIPQPQIYGRVSL